MRRASLILIATLLFTGQVRAEEPTPEQIQAGVDRGLPLAVKAAANYPQHRKCFACHHQTLPLLSMVARHGRPEVATDEAQREIIDFTRRSFHGRIDRLNNGKGIGGQAITVAYGLWTFELADASPDETTDAMVTYLLKTQRDDGTWKFQTHRPPLESSFVSTTVLSAYGLAKYARADQQDPAKSAIAKAQDWLAEAKLPENEDRVFRLWGLKLLGGDGSDLAKARKAVVAAQRQDGGWAQKQDMDSDAYATGQTLWVLRETGTEPSNAAFRKGIAWLLANQLDDGSWKVETRSKPVQTFFDNGDPHGKHQFISTAATCWAIAALANVKPE